MEVWLISTIFEVKVSETILFYISKSICTIGLKIETKKGDYILI